MPVVVDDAAAAAGFVSLTVTLLAGCIKGFTILSDAWKFGPDASFVRCLLEVEQHRLNAWADSIGLLDDQARLPLDLQDILVVRDILDSMASLLSDVEKLRSQYRLKLEVTDQEIEKLDMPDSTIGKLMLRTKPKFYQQAARVFRERNSPWKRLRWVVVDVERARTLTKDINILNDHLERFLPRTQSDALAVSLDKIMRFVIAVSTDVKDLKAFAQRQHHGASDGAVAATARCRQEGLSLGLLDRSVMDDAAAPNLSSRSTSPFSMSTLRNVDPHRRALALDANLLNVSESSGISCPRALALYDGVPVLLEWKVIANNAMPDVRHRIECVTAFLNGIVHPSFHSLRCRGFLKDPAFFEDPVYDRYGYVFDLPRESITASQQLTRMQTLRERIQNGPVPPSLNERLALSIALTETVLQLHTSGVLHKEIRPDNILFFPEYGSSPFLAGYTYARADSPLEATEAPESQFQEDLYRHPSSQGTDRLPYRKSFDLFGLGCVLLEIGLWSRLYTVLLQHAMQNQHSLNPSSKQVHMRVVKEDSKSSEYRSILRAKQLLLEVEGSRYFTQILEASSGKMYADVTMTCLHAETATQYNRNEGEDILDDILDVQETSLVRLRSITI